MVFSTSNLVENNITKDYILYRVSRGEILRTYTNTTNKKNSEYMISCPFHEDNNPSMSIRADIGRFKCFSCGESGDGISLLMKLENINYGDALKRIYRDFNLDLQQSNLFDNKLGGVNQSVGSSFNSQSFIALTINEEGVNRALTEIKVTRKDWEESDNYWQSYGIQPSVLKIFDVYPLKEYWINRWKAYTFNSKNPAYCFDLGREGEYKKILSPYSKYKWIGNVPKSIYSGYRQLPNNGDMVTITSSLKDVMVLYTLGYSAIAPQAESNLLDEWIIEDLQKRFKYIYVNYDNDFSKKFNSGQEFARRVIEKWPFIRNICLPEEYHEKDISDFVKKHGIGEASMIIDSLI